MTKLLWLMVVLFSSLAHAQILGPVLFGNPSATGANSCGAAAGYSNFASITIPAQSGMSADVSNFQMYVTGSSTWATVANGGLMQKSDGSDLIFCTASSGGTIVPFELEASSYSPTTGAGRWWITLPTLSHTVTTTIYYFIGNSGAVSWSNDWSVSGSVTSGAFVPGETLSHTTTGIGTMTATLVSASPTFIINNLSKCCFGATDTWTGGTSGAVFTPTAIPASLVWPNYVYVLHGGTPSSLSFADSTAITIPVVSSATAATGQLGGAFLTSGTGPKYAEYNEIDGSRYNALPAAGTSWSVTAWAKATSLPNSYNSIFSNENAFTSGQTIMVKSTGKMAIYVDSSSATDYDGTGTNTLSTGTNYMVGFSYNDTSKVLNGYVNGALDKTVTGTHAADLSGMSNQYIGNSVHTPRTWEGFVDEVRFASFFISTDQRLAEYNNQSSPGTFYTIH